MSMDERPLSPHLQVYRFQWTMAYSIFHRITGVALGVGTLYFAWWLLALASGPEAFATVQSFSGSWLGRLMLFGWTWALFYHLGAGVRHLFWDAGMGFELDTAEKSGHAVVGFSILATLALWVVAYSVL
ncbi:MAG: succinate dehydrogenase, cytochrome b556 subunit [Alphaproteobacteria bacterium]|nr:succinate dehydrogenase, cytochrome b556 subunit [Alphaproteobacteria bacterium]